MAFLIGTFAFVQKLVKMARTNPAPCNRVSWDRETRTIVAMSSVES